MVTVRGSRDGYEPKDPTNPRKEVSNGGSSVARQKFTHFADDVYTALNARGKTLQVVDAHKFGKTTYPAATVGRIPHGNTTPPPLDTQRTPGMHREPPPAATTHEGHPL